MTTPVKFRMGHMKADGFALDQAPENLRTIEALALQGISMDESNDTIRYVMDAMPATVTQGSANVPVQFLQHWMNKFITVVTQATMADEFLGRTTQGEWYQESVVLTVRELTGHTRPYGDHAQPPLAGYNLNEEERTIIRFSQGLLTGKLEEMRLAAMGKKLSAYESDRAAIGQSFNMDTNAVAFFGYKLGRNKTYGILNDPNLLPYNQVPEFKIGGDSVRTWSEKGFYGIVRDLNTAVGQLQKQCGGNFIPSKSAFKIGLALSCDAYLNSVNEYGMRSVREYIKETWPKAEVVPIPEFDAVFGGENVFYIKLEELGKSPVAEQIVPAAVRLVGMEPRATGVYELYSNATAGCFVEQPLGIVRYFGI